jgi:probable O-glycosylation ligase (exosortase A-associated)
MPESWFDRMHTISTYDEDKSALSRINAWYMAFNLALDRPVIGGGFRVYQPEIYERYAPDSTTVFEAHSIYFSAMAEHGFIGLALFAILILASWRTANSIVRHSAGRAELHWARNLAVAIKVSLVGYLAGGAFLSMLYFDLPYYLIAVLVLVERQVKARAVTWSESAHVLPPDASKPVNAPYG